jgi:hypothetical protein
VTTATALCAALLATTGCSSASSTSSAPSPTPAAGRTTSAAPSVTPSDTPGVPEPGSTAAPATTSGPLSRSSFPTPRQLGVGWRYAVDPGDAEEGYAGNGTPTLARSPREVVQTAVPLGCVRRDRMPLPTHALEADYTLHGATVIAVRSRFADRAAAVRFFAARSADLRACVGVSASAAIGPLVGAVTEPAEGALASERTPRSDPWRELAVLDGDTVVLLAVQGRHPLGPPATRRLVRLLRS